MTRKLRVTFVCHSENLSGGQRVIAIYANQLTRRGHSVTVVAAKLTPPGFREQVRQLLSGDFRQLKPKTSTASFLRDGQFTLRRLPIPDRSPTAICRTRTS